MLQIVIDNNTSDDFDVKAYMSKYWILVKETAVFIADYLVYDPMSDIYNIEAPVNSSSGTSSARGYKKSYI